MINVCGQPHTSKRRSDITCIHPALNDIGSECAEQGSYFIK